MLDAAEMALFDVGENRLQLLPRDTQGTPQGAGDAARSAIADGARLIIGPLLATEVEAAKPVAQGANVAMVAFSTATQLAGGGTFLMGFLPRQEIERVVGYAHAHGLTRLAVLAPRNPYGDIATDAARAAADANGTPLVRSAAYDVGTGEMSAAVKGFVGGGIDFDSLLLPEGGARLKALAPLLPYFDIDPAKVKYLGTGLWDDPTLGTEPELAGAWYAAPDPTARGQFEDRFKSLYKRPPPRLATLAYDATALASALTRGPTGGDLSAAAIENPNGFAGLDGIFRFTPDGLIQRGLAVIEVHRGGNTVVDPAPTTFEQRGY
jgi:ABC-type branched-subunit amino acid transport system substrate-binding protein